MGMSGPYFIIAFSTENQNDMEISFHSDSISEYGIVTVCCACHENIFLCRVWMCGNIIGPVSLITVLNLRF